MAYNRLATTIEVSGGTSPDTIVSPQTLKQNVWYLNGNNPSEQKTFGTTTDYDIPVIRNSIQRAIFENASWTSSSYPSAMTIGATGTSSALRFPLYSAVQHGILASTGGTLSFIVASGSTPSTSSPKSAVHISPAGNVGINHISPSTPLHISGITTQENFAVQLQTSLEANTDVDTGMEVITTVPISGSAAFFDYVLYNATKGSMRSGTIQAVWNATQIKYQEISTVDIGDTSGVTLSITNDTTIICLKATVTSDNWTIKAVSRTIV